MAASIPINELWMMLCDEAQDDAATTTTDSDITIDHFPELALDDEEYAKYFDVDNVLHFDPFEADCALVVANDTKTSARRRTELKRLAANGWQRDEPTDKILGKRKHYTYRGPNGVVETSLKRVMKQISVSLSAGVADDANCS